MNHFVDDMLGLTSLTTMDDVFLEIGKLAESEDNDTNGLHNNGHNEIDANGE